VICSIQPENLICLRYKWGPAVFSQGVQSAYRKAGHHPRLVTDGCAGLPCRVLEGHRYTV